VTWITLARERLAVLARVSAFGVLNERSLPMGTTITVPAELVSDLRIGYTPV
jgi:hypothetical protein